MKTLYLFISLLIITFCISSCSDEGDPEQLGNTNTSSVTISSLDVKNHQITITGANLDEINSGTVNISGTDVPLEICESSATKLVLTATKAINFIFETTYNFVFSTANASVNMPMTFSSKQVTMISGVAATNKNLPDSISTCRDYVGPCEYDIEGTACDSTSYSDWRLGYIEELKFFLNNTHSIGTTNTWSMTQTTDANLYFMRMRMDIGVVDGVAYTNDYSVVCVR